MGTSPSTNREKESHGRTRNTPPHPSNRLAHACDLISNANCDVSGVTGSARGNGHRQCDSVLAVRPGFTRSISFAWVPEERTQAVATLVTRPPNISVAKEPLKPSGAGGFTVASERNTNQQRLVRIFAPSADLGLIPSATPPQLTASSAATEGGVMHAGCLSPPLGLYEFDVSS